MIALSFCPDKPNRAFLTHIGYVRADEHCRPQRAAFRPNPVRGGQAGRRFVDHRQPGGASAQPCCAMDPGRVEAAMRDLGYVPNQVAGALASARTSSVGVLVPTIANSIFADTVQGLSDELEPLGYAVILAQSRYDAAREDHMLAALLSRRPEAIIMVGSPATEDGARLLRRAGIPSPRPGIFRRCPSMPSPVSTITRPGSRSRGISWRRGVGSWRSSAATIPGPHGAGMDSRMPPCKPVRKRRA